MGTSLCMIRGLGGCGKTTLSILISQILSMNKKKVLLVDCDVNTHGATYYFESYLSNNSNIYNTTELFFSEKNISNAESVIKITENLSFVPSIKNVKNNISNIVDFNLYNYSVLSNIYDVIVFDCQSGFSKINEEITRISDKKLIVLESDAISASATRTLYYQLKEQMKSGETYQVFNKTTDDDLDFINDIEFDKKIKYLNPILFDLEFKSTYFSLKFDYNNYNNRKNHLLYNGIFNIVSDLFHEYNFDFGNYIQLYQDDIRNHSESTIQNIMKKNINQKKLEILLVVMGICVSVVITVISLLYYSKEPHISKDTVWSLSSISLVIIVNVTMLIFTLIKNIAKYTINYNELQSQINEMNSNIEKLEYVSNNRIVQNDTLSSLVVNEKNGLNK